MLNIGFSELILILLVAFVIVGPKDLPKVARALARGIRSLQKLFDEFKEETGLSDTLTELQKDEKELTEIIRKADPTADLRKVQNETNKAIRDVKKTIDISK